MYVNEIFKLYYTARNYQTGLSTIRVLIRRPDNVNEGLFVMNEFDPAMHKGIYLYEYTPLIVGEYLFTVYQNGVWKFSKSEMCTVRPIGVNPVMEF